MKKKKSTHKGSPKGAQILWDRAQKVQKEWAREMLKKDPDIFKAFFENKDNASDKEIIKLFPLSSKEL